MLKSIFLSAFLLSVTLLHAQVKFSAHADATQIVADQYFTITFSLENARGGNFRAPSFKDFEVAGGPSTSSEMTFINGRSTQKISYSYTLTASNVGKYQIGPAQITVNGKTMQSNPVSIEVVKGRSANNSNVSSEQEDFIVEAQLDFDTAYVGQQLTLKYVLLTTKDVRSFNFQRLPDFDGFFAQEIQSFDARTTRVVINGTQYFKRVLKVIALFPQQKGVFELSPADLTLGISDGRRSSSFFFNTRLRQYRIRSTRTTAIIRSTPPGAPKSFSGAIGDFYMGTSVDKRTISMDDALTLTLQVRGFGDGKFIQPPEQPYTHLFDIYDPNLLEEKSDIVGDKIQVTKTYEYLMIPKKTGSIKFNPELTYFDVDSNKYVTIYAQQYRVNVVKGADRELADIVENDSDLPQPRAIGKLVKSKPGFAYSFTHIGLNVALVAAILGLFVARRIRDQRENIDPAVKRAQRAKKLAVAKLSEAKSSLDKGDISAFYTKLRKGLLEYLSDRINLPTSQLSKNDIQQLLENEGMHSMIEPLLEIMRKGEQAIYASIAPGHEQTDYDQSIHIIEQVEISLSDKV